MCESTDLFPVIGSGDTGPEISGRERLGIDDREFETVVMTEVLAHGPHAPVTTAITKVYGPCPLGMMPGNTWNIERGGKLSRPMCRPGATALSALFRMSDGDAMGRSTCCECTFAGREVTFTVREPVAELMEELSERPG